MDSKENLLKVLVRRFFIFITFILSGVKIVIFRPYWHDKYVKTSLVMSLLLNASNWLYLIINRIGNGYPIILHYNLFFGVDFLGDYRIIFVIPFVGVLVFLLNTILGDLFYRGERLASYILTLNIFIIQFFLFLASYLIIQVNS